MSSKTINQLPVATVVQDTDEIVVSQGTGAGDVKSSTLAVLKTWINAGGTSSAGVTANNGLTETSGNVQLGGTLTQNTTIELGGNDLVIYQTAPSGAPSSGMVIEPGATAMFNITSDGTSAGSAIATNTALIEIGTTVNVTTGLTLKLNNGSDGSTTGAVLQDDIFNKGFTYAADYSANGATNDRWLPDYGAVKALVATGASPTGAAGGDLAGTYPNPSVNTINGITNAYYDPASSIQTQLDSKQDSLGFTPENTANKNQVNGYAGLDGTGKIAASQLPSYVDDVLEAANFAALPVTGETGKIYVTLDTNLEYRWSGSNYIQIVASPGTTDALAEGTTNLYFTIARVLATLLTGIGFSDATAVTAADSILLAFGKLQAQITALFKIPSGGTRGQVLSKIDNTSGNTQWTDFSFANLSGSPVTDITYANLVSALSGSTLIRGLYYRITDFQTVHTIPATSTVNTGPIEPLIVLAVSSNTLSSSALSEQYPQDVIQYTTSNSYIAGATKGCILSRHDRTLNVKVSNDFRNVKYRRWRLVAPANFDNTIAIPQYTLVTAADGGMYYCSKPGGFAAGAATTPSLTDDNWVQVFVNNNYYYARAGSGTAGISITSNQSPSYTVPKFSINGTDFVDTPMFPNYGTGFQNIDINNGPGNLMNLVFWNDNQATIINSLTIGVAESTTPGATFSSTFILTGQGRIQGLQFLGGLQYSYITATGMIYKWSTERLVYACTANVSSIYHCSFNPNYGLLRGSLYQVIGAQMEFTVTPMVMNSISFPMGMGNLKFNTTANAVGWNIHNGLGTAFIGTPTSLTFQSSTPDVVVDTAMSWRTFLGYADITSGGSHGPSTDLSTQIAMAKTKLIVYDYEEPSSKSMIDITTGTARSVVWQTETPGVNLTTPSGYNSSSKTIRTYFTKHGNDFQVQQKDLISGVWTPNNTPGYTIDAVDGSGNVTSVTFTPNTGATESRFIIV